MEAGKLYGAVSQGMERKSSLNHAEEPRLIAGGFLYPDIARLHALQTLDLWLQGRWIPQHPQGEETRLA